MWTLERFIALSTTGKFSINLHEQCGKKKQLQFGDHFKTSLLAGVL